jgi:hypothetical protein
MVLLLVLTFYFSANTLAQPLNDDCTGAILLPQTGYCMPTAGTSMLATESIPAIYCYGTAGSADDDVWYKFVAVTTNPTITVMPAQGFDVVVDLRSGACDGVNINCADYKGPSGTETIYTGGLLVGQTYLVRVYGFGSGAASQGNFSICVHGMPPYPPVNDNCTGALFVEYPGPNLGTTFSSSKSAAPVDCEGLTGDSDDDVWYQFSSTTGNQTITVEGVLNFDPVVDLREGFCDGNTIACSDLTASGGFETLKITGLLPGPTYLIRIYSYGPGSNSEGEFAMSVSESVCPTCPSYDFTLNPIPSWQTHHSSLFSSSCNMYKAIVTSGNEYTFKTGCGDGAFANFDTQLQLLDENCNSILTDDNSCEENRSQITWEATYTGPLYLKITGKDPNTFGSYTLSYRTPYPVSTDGRENPSFHVYPNPTKGRVHLGNNNDYTPIQVQVFDFTGRKVKSEPIQNSAAEMTLDLSLEPGLYLLAIITVKGISFSRLEVVR